MLNRYRLVGMVTSLLVPALILVACTQAPAEADDPFGVRRATEIIASENPPAGPIRVGGHLTVEFIGKGELVDEEPEVPEADEETAPGSDGSDEGPVDEVDFGRLAFHVFNPATGNIFELTFEQPLLEAVHAFQAARGLTEATEGVDDPEELERPPTPQGWSNGSDDRLLRTATTSWPWRTIAQFGEENSRCTGTLIGPRHLITAAHCINKRATNQWYTVQVDPGRNGLNNSPYGSSTISLNPPPGTSAWYFTPAPWRSSACAGENYKCAEWDWGVIVIPDRLGDLTGWMGYWAGPASYLNARTHYNRGYPSCTTDKGSKPALCDVQINDQDVYWARLFGDVASCKLGSYHHPGPDGWNRTIMHSCDTSPGHSGSALYHYRFNTTMNKWMPVVSMVHNSATCQVCDASKDHPNRVRRITPGDLGIIGWLRNAFP